MTVKKRFALVQVEFDPDTSADDARTLTTQLLEFVATIGDGYLIDDGITTATEDE